MADSGITIDIIGDCTIYASATQEMKIKIDLFKHKYLVLEEQQRSIELDPYDYEESYCEMLDEIDEWPAVGSITFQPSRVLRELDPTAYRCGLNDYVDSIDITETEQYEELEERLTELEGEIDLLEQELEELEELEEEEETE